MAVLGLNGSSGTMELGSNRVPTALDNFPSLKVWKGKVESNDGIAKYLASDAYAGLGKFGPSTLGK